MHRGASQWTEDDANGHQGYGVDYKPLQAECGGELAEYIAIVLPLVRWLLQACSPIMSGAYRSCVLACQGSARLT